MPKATSNPDFGSFLGDANFSITLSMADCGKMQPSGAFETPVEVEGLEDEAGPGRNLGEALSFSHSSRLSFMSLARSGLAS